MNKKKILFITFFKWDWRKYPFFKKLDEFGVKYDVLNREINSTYRSRIYLVCVIWPKLVWFALRILIRARSYDIVVFWDPIIAFVLGIFHSLGVRRHPKLILIGMIYTKRQNRVIGALRRWCYRYIAGTMDHIICHSNFEREDYAQRFKTSVTKFSYVPLAIGMSTKFNNDQRTANTNGGYIVSAGRTNRNYVALIRAASELNYPLKIVADYTDGGLPHNENVSIIRNAYGFDYLRLLRDARFVVIPLKERDHSSGQTVLLQAMKLGKTVVFTKTRWSADYISNGENGVEVDTDNAQALRNVLQYLYTHPEKCSEIGEKAKESVAQNHCEDVYVGKIVECIAKAAA